MLLTAASSLFWELNDPGFGYELEKSYRIGYWLLSSYLVAVGLYAGALFLRKARTNRSIYRRQAAVFVIAVAIPVAGAVVSSYVQVDFDPTPISAAAGVWIAAELIPLARRMDTRAAIRARAFSNTPDPLIVTDAEFHILDCNRAAAKLVPKESAFAGRLLHDVWPELADFIAADGKEAPDFRTRNCVYEVAVETIKQDEIDLGRVVSLRDVTKREEAEAQRNRVLERKAIEERDDGFALLTGGIAREFNNALMAIVGQAESLDHEEAKLIQAEGMKIAETIEHLMVYTRQRLLRKSIVDTKTVLEKVMCGLKDRGYFDTIICRVSIAEQNLTTSTDEAMLEDALKELSDNALEAMNASGTLQISASRKELDGFIPYRPGPSLSGAYVVVEFSDDGIGMDASTAKRVIDPFFTTKNRVAHRGFGLSKVFGLARLCDGDVFICSTPGKGTTVSLFLPAVA